MADGSGGVESEMGISGLWIAVIIGVIIVLTVILAFLIRYVYNFGIHKATTICIHNFGHCIAFVVLM